MKLVETQFTRQDLISALENSPEFFIQFFMQDALDFPVPAFHSTVFKKMTVLEVDQFACAIPRGHAKTTLAKLACVWLLLFSPVSFIIYLSNTKTLSVASLQDVIAFMKSDNFAKLFGELVFDVEQEGNGFYIFKFNSPKGKKTCILRALGAGQQLRGTNIRNQRPQVAIVDDLEDLDGVTNEEQYFMQIRKWFYGTFKKALARYNTKIIQIGNMISPNCLLKLHIDSEDWHSMRLGALLADGKPLWPELWTLEALKKDFKEYVNAGMMHVWFAEMMNLPLAAGMGLIRPDQISFRPPVGVGDIDFGCITIDLAASEHEWAHRTVLVVHGFVNDDWQMLEHKSYIGMDPAQLFDDIVELCFKWQIVYVGIEDAAFQQVLSKVFNYMMLVNNIEGIEFVPLAARDRKYRRIAAWVALMRRKEYYLSEGELDVVSELMLYDPSKKQNNDDLIDAAAYIVQMMDEFLLDIMEAKLPEGQVPPTIEASYAICGV